MVVIMRCPSLAELPAPPRGKRGWPWTEESPQLPEIMPTGDPWPKISIVTPSYNQGRFIEETIRSVLLQGYPNLEYIVIDGGSTDDALEIIKKYEKRFSYWVSEPDRGQSHAINKGFEKANGEIYGWLNSDDFLLNNALRNVANAHYVSPKAGSWVGGCLKVNTNGKTLWVSWPNRLERDALVKWLENNFAQSACFFSKEAWQKCGPLDENLCYAMDLNLWLNIAKEFSIEKVSELLSVDHIHNDAKTTRSKAQMFAEICLVQIRHGYEGIAFEDISRWIDKYLKLQGRLDRISQSFLFRAIMFIPRVIRRRFP
jgi:glycosyltransferase involved in cell wall biosynthesis